MSKIGARGVLSQKFIYVDYSKEMQRRSKLRKKRAKNKAKSYPQAR